MYITKITGAGLDLKGTYAIFLMEVKFHSFPIYPVAVSHIFIKYLFFFALNKI